MIKKILKSYDYTLIFSVFLLCVFGLVMVYSSSMISAVTRFNSDSAYFFNKQLIFVCIGAVAFLIAAVIPYRILLTKKLLKSIMFISVGLLLILFVYGHTAGNAKSWIKIAGFTMQPAEFVKLSVIIYLAAVYEKKQAYINNFKKAVMPPLFFTTIICGLIVIQPDLGTAMIIALIMMTMVFSSGMNWKSIIGLALLALLFLALISPLILLNSDRFITEERVSRFEGFTDPFGTEKDAGYHLANSLYAIGSGGITGLGLGNSVQKYGYLPESHTDFIMSIVAEELGIFGVLFVLSLLGVLIFKGFYIARKCEDAFGTLLAIGISSMIAIQAGINLGGMTGLIPITGVTLPFISYGGSSMLVLMISAGLLVNVSMFTNYREGYKSDAEKSVSKKREQNIQKPVQNKM
ncbi:putative lipid II flippase FtsW [Metabacillus sp. KIGAM252]|uniref:Probable peptidoglycan glycosyltransferase FtsW n=1 Tax=Metabacillus flavus TaxID=2823519 RepID=A0ABS5LDP6_9BACI|nr:putative lipid II flippase FtsW [Metabacillus flavus]MBS2968831.1 putative lipid II flippase FtsW [Metabacillus flavus]